MAITIVELRQRIGNPNESKVSDEQLDRNLESAVTLMDQWLGIRKSKVPADIYDTALLGVAQQLYYRDTKDTSSGGQYTQGGEFVATVIKDPMHYAYPLLRRFVGWF